MILSLIQFDNTLKYHACGKQTEGRRGKQGREEKTEVTEVGGVKGRGKVGREERTPNILKVTSKLSMATSSQVLFSQPESELAFGPQLRVSSRE